MKIIDLDKVAGKLGLRGKYADKLILLSSEVIVVLEETGRPKPDDVAKLENTIQALKHGVLKRYLKSHPEKIVALIHAKRRDTMIPKILASKTRKQTIYRKASCNREVNAILEKIQAQTRNPPK